MKFKDLFKKKSNENTKKDQFICGENISSMVHMMAVVDVAEIIGIESGELYEAIEDKKKNIDEDILNFIKKISSEIDDEFIKKVLYKIIFFATYGKIDICNQELSGIYKTKNNKTYNLKIVINDKNISFSLNDEKNSKERTGDLKVKPDNSFIISYGEIDTQIYNLPNNSKSQNIGIKRQMLAFNSSKIQDFEYNYEKKDNFIVDNVGMKTIKDPSPFENYYKKEYKWRVLNNKIIMRSVMNYVLESEFNKNHDEYLVANNVAPADKRLPFGGHFCGIDKAQHREYMQKASTSSAQTDNISESKIKKLVY